jgi:hypothetical protein
MSNEIHMNIVAAIMFATGKATSIKQAVHMAAQIDESVTARLAKDAPPWVKSANEVLSESNKPSGDNEEE